MTDAEGLQDIKQYFPNGVTTAMKKTFCCGNESYLFTSSACWSGITKEIRISPADKTLSKPAVGCLPGVCTLNSKCK